MEKYAPEVLLGLFATLYNVVLVIACAWLTATLYQRSGSWHCLWALLMLLALKSYRFVRD